MWNYMQDMSMMKNITVPPSDPGGLFHLEQNLGLWRNFYSKKTYLKINIIDGLA